MMIDIIIPTYNRAGVLNRAIESVLNQSYQNFKIMIIDDGSTDETNDILKKYCNHPQIQILTQKNKGVSAARNYGILNSHSPWISFLDSDDEWLKDKLKKQVDFIQNNPLCQFLHSEEIWMRNNVRVNPKKKHSKNSENIALRSLDFCLISPSTVLLKRTLFEKYGPFKETFIVCEDYDLWNKILARISIDYLNEALVIKYGGHEDQLSTQFVAMDLFRIKSLHDLYEQKDIENSHKLIILEVIKKKAHILLKGYEKHNQLSRIKELQALLHSLEVL